MEQPAGRRRQQGAGGDASWLRLAVEDPRSPHHDVSSGSHNVAKVSAAR